MLNQRPLRLALTAQTFVIPTGAYPDFLPHCLDRATCAAFRKESRMKFADATNLDKKSGVAQWRDLRSSPRAKTATTTVSFARSPARSFRNLFLERTVL